MNLIEGKALYREPVSNLALLEWQGVQRQNFLQTLSKRGEIKKLYADYIKLPYQDVAPIQRDEMVSRDGEIRAALAEHKVRGATDELLLKAFEKRSKHDGVSSGVWALQELEKTREEARFAEISVVDSAARQLLTPDVYKDKYTILPDIAKRELVAEALAKKAAAERAIRYMEPIITTEEIQSLSQKNAERGNIKNGKTQFGNHDGTSIPVANLASIPENLTKNIQPAHYDINTWLTLPIKPLVIPNGEVVDRNNPRMLAEYFWNKIFYSPLLVDRHGAKVKMNDEVTEKYISKIETCIREGKPIRASEYTPLIAMPNPLKRRTQTVGLAEIDFFRRLAEVSEAVSLFYEPGVQWEVINEIPAFIDAFHIDPTYVDTFHNDCQAIVSSVNQLTGKETIRLSRMDTYLNKEKKQYEEYRKERTAYIQEVYGNPDHPNHDDIWNEVQTFIYPMATCTNPLECEATWGMSVSEVVRVYEKLREITKNNIGGIAIGSSSNDAGAIDENTFSPQQVELLGFLEKKGLELAINYRVTMGARDVLPSFKESSDGVISYTMVTKGDKPNLYPTSHRGQVFPAHGEAILIPNEDGWPTVDVKQWIQLIANQDEEGAVPNMSQVTQDVLYFI